MILQNIDDGARRRLRTVARDGVDLYLAESGTIRIALVQASALVLQMAANHKTNDSETTALGEAYVATLLTGSTLKNDERLGLLYDSDGSGFTCDVDGTGSVRGYLRHTKEGLLPRDGAGRWNEGTIGVIRYQGRSHTPFAGETLIPSGTLADAVRAYTDLSDQTPSRLSVVVEAAEGSVTAGGVLVQGLPGADTDAIEAIHRLLEIEREVTSPFAPGETPSAFVASRLAGRNVRFVGSRRAEFYCGCNRSRFARFLGQLPKSECDDILAHGPLPLVTTCHNCNTSYSFTLGELERIFTSDDPG